MTDTTPTERHAVIIEDDPEIADLLAAVLAQAGFRTHTATDGVHGLDLIREYDPMLTTLDVNLPGIDGFEVARRIRSFSTTYVIILSARREEIDTLMGLNAGADDYLSKPFRPRELRARVEAMIRRRELEHQAVVAATPATPSDDESDGDWLSHNGLLLHPSMRLVELDGSPVELTRTEFDLLSAVMQRSRRVISKDELAIFTRNDVNGYVIDADRRSIESHIANLRRKLSDSVTKPRFIETVRGVGYRLAKSQN
ncbi:MAG: response regulator transcription factor [Micropruina sp.]|uniref:response regulator transcription factor n=1 Tax=Micropruina sp. TaxID=2737536 RepID=UPI0039E5F933